MKIREPLSRRPFHFVIFLNLISAVVLGLEVYFLSPAVDSQVFPLTVAVTIGFEVYIIQTSKQKRSSGAEKLINGSFKDDALTSEYSEYSQKILKKDLEIYRLLDRHSIRTRSPVFSIAGRIPRIFVLGDFFYNLNPEERKVLIFHEIGHYVHKDHLVVRLLTILFLISIASLAISLSFILNVGLNALIETLIVSFLIASIIILGMLKAQLVWQEYRADKFASIEMRSKAELRTALERTYEYTKMQCEKEKSRRRNESFLSKRLKHLGD